MNFKRLVLNIITLVFTLQVNAIPFNYGSKISKKVVLVGDTLSYTVEAYCTPSCQLVWPNLQSSIQEPLVILQKGELQKTEEAGAIKYSQTLKISCYDSGLHAVLPIQIVNTCDTLAVNATDTIYLLVNNVPVDLNADIKEEEDTIDGEGLTPGQKKALIIFGALALIALGIFLYYKYGRAKKYQKNEIVNPYQQALDTLKNAKLKGNTEQDFKEYYSTLTQCLKNYLQQQIKIPILDKTSAQAQTLLLQNSFTKTHANNIVSIFGRADFAKFAKLPPTQELAQADHKTVSNIINNIEAEYLKQLQLELQKQAQQKKKL